MAEATTEDGPSTVREPLTSESTVAGQTSEQMTEQTTGSATQEQTEATADAADSSTP